MNLPTEPTLKDATEPTSTFSEGNNEGDYFCLCTKQVT